VISKTSVRVMALCVVIIVSFSVTTAMADQITPSTTHLAFTSAMQFLSPTINGSVSFAQAGYYENVTLVNDTWVFIHLQLDSQQPDLLSDSPTTADLNITTQNSNITITSFERLLTPDSSDWQNQGSWLTAGWLNYTVSGIGKQVIKIEFNLAAFSNEPASMWPINVNVYLDGEKAQFNVNWTNIGDDETRMLPYGTGLIVYGAASNVSVQYSWVPVPEPASQGGSPSNSPSPSPEVSYLHVLVLVAVACAIIIPLAVYVNRHRLETTMNQRNKTQAISI
jgi:hypothetical protein